MSKVQVLKEALLDELISQVSEGPVVLDKETGEAVRVSPPASLLSVAAKVVKDFADEIPKQEDEDKKRDTLMRFMEARKVNRSAPLPMIQTKVEEAETVPF